MYWQFLKRQLAEYQNFTPYVWVKLGLQSSIKKTKKQHPWTPVEFWESWCFSNYWIPSIQGYCQSSNFINVLENRLYSLLVLLMLVGTLHFIDSYIELLKILIFSLDILVITFEKGARYLGVFLLEILLC